MECVLNESWRVLDGANLARVDEAVARPHRTRPRKVSDELAGIHLARAMDLERRDRGHNAQSCERGDAPCLLGLWSALKNRPSVRGMGQVVSTATTSSCTSVADP